MSASPDPSTTPKAEPLEYNLTIRALPSDVPATIRLRALLKSILRRFEFRCTSIRELNAATDASAADNPRHSNAVASEGTGYPEGREGTADAPECGVGPLEKVPRYSGGGSRRIADVSRAKVSQAIASNSK